MTEPIPSIEMDEGTLQCELPGPATFSHSGSPLPVRFEEASERLAVQAIPNRWTSWIVFVFSFMPAMPALSAMGHLEILQQLTNLAGRLPRINPLRSTDSPRHRRTRSRRSRSSRRKSNSPRSKMDSPSQPQVLAPQNATPIRRGQRTSYTAIANRRRTEANGTMTQTLFRVSNLVPTNEANAQNNPNPTNPDENTADIQQPAIDTTDSATEANPNALEVNRPVVDSDQPRGWSRWIFNNVSRRWTSIRDRLAPHGTEADQTTGSETETAAKAETEAEPHLVSEAKNTPTETPEKPAASVKPVSSRRPPRPPFEHLIRREPSKYHKRSHDARERLFATPYTPRRSQIPKTRDVQTTSKDCHESGSEKVIPPNSTPKPSKLVPGPSMRAQDCLTSPTQQIQEPNESRPSEPQPNASQVNASQSSTPQLNAFQAESTKDLKPMDPLEQELQKVYEAQYELIQKKRLENRRSPDTIPGPRDGGYGLDDDFYDGDSDEGALAEKQYELEQRLAKKRKIEEEVDNPNKRRKHVITSSRPPTRTSRRIQTTNHSLTTNLSPITSDGSSITPKKDKEPVGPSIPATTPHVPVPNPHGTFTAPGWTSSEDEATPSTEENQAPVSHNQAPASERQATPPGMSGFLGELPSSPPKMCHTPGAFQVSPVVTASCYNALETFTALASRFEETPCPGRTFASANAVANPSPLPEL